MFRGFLRQIADLKACNEETDGEDGVSDGDTGDEADGDFTGEI